MSILLRRRSLALSAILSSALVPAFALGSPSAHAVNPGPSDSTLTVSDGTSTVLVAGKPVTFPTTVTDATWAPNGSRLAYVDGDGNLVSSLPDGSGVRVLAHGGPGIVISKPTWSSDGGGVAFAESVNGVFGPIKIAKADGYGTSASGGGDGSAVISDWSMGDGGAYSSPDAVYVPNGTSPAQSIVPNFVFQKVPAGSGMPEIWGIRNFAREAVQYKIADGTQPTISPDGKTVAFVDGNGQIDVVDVSHPTPSAPKVLTKGVTAAHPTFSPDGGKITFETLLVRNMGLPPVPRDVESVPAAGGSTTVESKTGGVPSYRPTALTHVTRLAGADRVGTAISISQARFPDGPNTEGFSHEVVLARSDQYADALAGSALARSAPMLLTEPGALNPAVQAEMVRVLGPVTKDNPQTVTLLGGPEALSPAVESAIQKLGYRTQRLQGPDRFATSVAIAKAVSDNAWPTRIVVATGENFADALSAGPVDEPIVLTDDKVMPPEVGDYLKFYGTQQSPGQRVATIYEVGGQAKAATEGLFPAGSPNRPTTVALAGLDRFETSFLVAKEFFGADPAEPGRVHLGTATAYNWPDSLAGAGAMAQLQGPMLLVDPNTGLTPQEQQWVSANSGDVGSALVFGGPMAVSPTVDMQLGTTLSGPAGYVMATNPPSIP